MALKLFFTAILVLFIPYIMVGMSIGENRGPVFKFVQQFLIFVGLAIAFVAALLAIWG